MYDNDLDNNNTSSGVTGSESQNSQESTEYTKKYHNIQKRKRKTVHFTQ